MSDVQKVVEIINTKNNQQFVNFTNDPMDTIVIPPRGRLVKSLTSSQIAILKSTNLQFNVK